MMYKDLKTIFNDEVIGHISFDNNEITLHKLIDKDIKNILIYINGQQYQTIDLNGYNYLPGFKKSNNKNITGFIFG